MTSLQKNRYSIFVFSAGLWIFCIGLLRYLHRPFGMDFDGAEQTYLAQWFELGSGIQPPLPTWIFHFVFEWFGHSVAWIHSIRLFLVFLIYVGFYKLSTKIIKNASLALVATLSLAFIFQFSSVMLKQMHTVFITLAVIYSWLCIVEIYEKGKLRSFLWLGFWVGIGFLSKYNFFIHVGALLVAVLSIKELRSRILKPQISLSVLVAVLLCSPHYIWLIENLNAVTGNVGADLSQNSNAAVWTDRFRGMVDLTVKLFAFGGVLLLAFIGFFYSAAKQNLSRREPVLFKLLSRYMIIALLMLILVILITSATKIREHWLQPFLIVFPILLFQKLNGTEESLKRRLQTFKIVCLAIFVLISVDFAFKSYVKVYTGHPASVFNIPYKDMAGMVMEVSSHSEVVFTNDINTAGHIKMILPEKLILLLEDHNHLQNEKNRIQNADNMIFVWNPKNESEVIPFNGSDIRNATGLNLFVVSSSTRIQSFNYVLTDERFYDVGVAEVNDQ